MQKVPGWLPFKLFSTCCMASLHDKTQPFIPSPLPLNPHVSSAAVQQRLTGSVGAHTFMNSRRSTHPRKTHGQSSAACHSRTALLGEPTQATAAQRTDALPWTHNSTWHLSIPCHVGDLHAHTNRHGSQNKARHSSRPTGSACPCGTAGFLTHTLGGSDLGPTRNDSNRALA